MVGELTPPVGTKMELSRHQERLESQLETRLGSMLTAKVILFLQKAELGRAEIASELGHKRVSGELNKQIKRLLEMELIERTLPEKPTSRLQKYRLTEKGRSVLEGIGLW